MNKRRGWSWRSLALAVFVAGAVVVGVTAWHTPATQAQDKTAILQDLSDGFAQLSEEASPAVVFIQVEKTMRPGGGGGGGYGNPFGLPDDFFDRFFGQGGQGAPWQQPRQQQQPQAPAPNGKTVPYGQGSGFIISPDGYIITNHHVVAEADKIKVRLGDKSEYEAKVIGSDPNTEIALIKIDAKNLPTLPLGDSDKLRVGEWVVAIGNPFGLSHTVTSGIVSAKGRGNLGIVDSDKFFADFIQTDAAINPGNSGGPLLNLKGEVVGVNTAIFSQSGGYMGIGFAIPINMVKYIRDQLLDKGEISRGFLGVVIQDLTPDLGKWFDGGEGKGVLVAEVSEDSPAAKAGLKRDDIITKFDGHEVTDVQTFRSRVSTTKPGTDVELVLMRNGKEVTKDVTIGKLDEKTGAVVTKEGEVEGVHAALGLTVQNLTDDLAGRLGYEHESGVVVSGVEPGSAAEQAGLKTGVLIQEVNRERVRNTKEFQEALKKGADEKSVLLLVKDGQYSRYIALSVEE